MDLRKKKALFIPIIIVIFCLAGCATTTQLVRSWQEPDFTDKPLNKILVLGAFENAENRRMYEDGVVKALKKKNHPAIASYTLEPDMSKLAGKEEIKALVKKTDADAVMIAILGSVDKEKTYVPPNMAYVPMMGYGRGMYDYYLGSQQAVLNQGYIMTDTRVKLEITVFSVKTEKMIWAGATESLNPASKERLVDEAAAVIMDDMKKEGFL